jgi:hypothetical protein
VGLGRGRDNNERILAVRNEQLYGLIRYPQPDDSSRYGPWKVHRIEATDIYARAEAIAEKWGVETLMNRGTSWRGRMISQKQASYLARLARGHLKLAAIRPMTAGEAAQAITHYQALDALGRADV